MDVARVLYNCKTARRVYIIIKTIMGRIVRLRCARALPATSRMNEIECGFIGRLPMCILVDGGGGGGGGKRK